MAHHGMKAQHGINAMCENNPNHEGRFGRLFPTLNPNYTHPETLKGLGKQGGPMDGGKARNPSATIPMWAVFFGQFIDHDITLDTTSALDQLNDPAATENFRTPALDLDSVYGAGPEANAFLYKDGLYLLIGKDGSALVGQNSNHRDNDLTRTSAGTAIIGDPRNDENRIISQMQLAFINFHNKVVDHLIADKSISANRLKSPRLRKELFEEARKLVTWHYQWIVLYEFLPIIIGRPVVNKILCQGRQFYIPKKRPFIPIEFSVAAYRFGHSLAPQKLKVRNAQARDFELFGATLGFGFAPIGKDEQIVEWAALSATNGPLGQTTDQLDTKLPSDLLNLPFIREGEKSLATRNLQRGQSFLLPSGDKVARHMGIEEIEIQKVLDFINLNTVGLDLSNGIPLWYYILAEAEVIGRMDVDGNKPGEGLGPVGATIVGETLIGLLEKDAMSFLSTHPNPNYSTDRNWLPSLGGNSSFTMADLLAF